MADSATDHPTPAGVDSAATAVAGTARSSGYVGFVVVTGFLAWALVSMDNVMLGVALPALSAPLGLSVSTLEYLVGIFAFVTFATPVLVGRWVDRVGRRASFQGSLLGTGIFGGLTAAVGSAWQFIVVRLIAATSYGLTEPAVNTMVAEEAPRRHRGFLMGFVQAGYPLGAGITGTIAAVLLPSYGWRPLFLVAFAPVAIVLASSFFLRESRRFDAVKQVSRRGDVEHRPGWRALFTPDQRRQTVVTSVFGFCINGGIGLIIGVVTTYLVHVDGLSLAAAAFLFGVSNWTALVSQIFVGWLADYLPAKWLMTVYSVLGAAALALLALPDVSSTVPTAIPIISAVLVLLGAVTIACGKSFPPRRDLEELAPSKLLGQAPAS